MTFATAIMASQNRAHNNTAGRGLLLAGEMMTIDRLTTIIRSCVMSIIGREVKKQQSSKEFNLLQRGIIAM